MKLFAAVVGLSQIMQVAILFLLLLMEPFLIWWMVWLLSDDRKQNTENKAEALPNQTRSAIRIDRRKHRSA